MKTWSAIWSGKAEGVNRHFLVRHGRMIKSPAYRAFQDSLVATLLPARVVFDEYCDLEVRVWLWKMRDSDGILKPVCDALENAGIVENDRLIRNKVIRRHYHRKGEQDMILLTLTSCDEQELEQLRREQNGLLSDYPEHPVSSPPSA